MMFLKSRFNRIVLFLLLALAPWISMSLGDDGHGVGSGNGLPVVTFPEVTLGYVPRAADLETMALRWARSRPTMGMQILELMRRFEGRVSGYRFVHLVGHYPFQKANSRHSDRLDALGIPSTAEIFVWDDFFEMPVEEQLHVLVHEISHILFTGADEAKTEALVRILLDGGEMSAPELRLSQHGGNPSVGPSETPDVILASLPWRRLWDGFHSLYPEDDRGGVVASAPLFQRARDTYLRATGQRRPCQEYESGRSFPMAGSTLVLPWPGSPLEERLAQDPFFKWDRDFCLSRSSVGRSLLKGPHADPLVHRAFLKGLLGNEPEFRLHSQQEEGEQFQGKYPTIPGTTNFFRDLRLVSDRGRRSGSPSFEQLARLNPELLPWVQARSRLLSSEERRLRYHYGPSEALRYPGQWVTFMNERGVILDVRCGQGASDPLGGPMGCRGALAVRCLFLGSAFDVACRYESASFFGIRSVERLWHLDLTWALLMAGEEFRRWAGVDVGD